MHMITFRLVFVHNFNKFSNHAYRENTTVYDSLVRMAQDFSLRTRLIHGHGNFGSIIVDPTASMRYTKCRLKALTEKMLLADLVDFVPNFDNSQNDHQCLLLAYHS